MSIKLKKETLWNIYELKYILILIQKTGECLCFNVLIILIQETACLKYIKRHIMDFHVSFMGRS